MKIAIIADDLTSATDTSIQFTRSGYSAEVVFYDQLALKSEVDVVAVDTNSRAQSAAEAQRRTRVTARGLKDSPIIYKTVDSTLRGHLGLELSALLQETEHKTAIIAPAFPLCGRTTQDGAQLLHGRLVHETEFAFDPANPVISSQIASLLQSPDLAPVMMLSRKEIRDPNRVQGAIASARCVVVDSETQDDLRALVQAVADLSTVCWVGSPGLARALADQLPRLQSQPAVQPQACKRVLIVVGSLNPVTRAQLKHLLSQKNTVSLTVQPSRVVGGRAARDRIVQQMEEHFRLGHTVVLCSPDKPVRSEGNHDAGDAVRSLAEVACRAITEQFADGLVVTGGATAEAVLRRAGITGLRLENEVTPGIPTAKAVHPHELRIVTKAGGFGSENALLESYSALTAGGSN